MVGIKEVQKRCLLKHPLNTFSWIALSRHPDYIDEKGSLFHAPDYTGKRKEQAGRLIKKPVTIFSDLSGQNESEFHR